MKRDGKRNNSEPKRIVYLSPSNTEMPFALGLDVEIVEVTELCDYPLQTRLKEMVSGFLKPQTQRIRALWSDIVLAYGGIQNLQVKELVREGQTI